MESEKTQSQRQDSHLSYLYTTGSPLWLRVLDTRTGSLEQTSGISHALPTAHSKKQME